MAVQVVITRDDYRLIVRTEQDAVDAKGHFHATLTHAFERRDPTDGQYYGCCEHAVYNALLAEALIELRTARVVR